MCKKYFKNGDLVKRKKDGRIGSIWLNGAGITWRDDNVSCVDWRHVESPKSVECGVNTENFERIESSPK